MTRKKGNTDDQSEKSIEAPPEKLTLDKLLKKVEAAKAKGIHGNSATGSAGEEFASLKQGWLRRPTGAKMKQLMAALEANDIRIQPTSFDAIAVPEGVELAFKNPKVLAEQVNDLTFVEIKSGRREELPEDFSGFFFALTYREIQAAIALGNKHVVALVNVEKPEQGIFITNVWSLLDRSTSTNWQLSIQLGKEMQALESSEQTTIADQPEVERKVMDEVFLKVAQRLASRRASNRGM